MFDLILAGGGLANGLLAYRLAQRRPELRILLVERDRRLGGTHTWSFFGTDLTAAQHEWMAPFIDHRWPFYDVAFPGLRRRIQTSYCSFSDDRFHTVISDLLRDAVRLDTTIHAIDPGGVTLTDGQRLEARAVIDGRGYRPSSELVLAFQKFTGEVLELTGEHHLAGPILMDATVPQQQGFRFFYTLPLTRRRLLVEDTRYSDDWLLEPERDAVGIEEYARGRGWRVGNVLRRETGVLPVALAGDIAALWGAAGNVPLSGLRAGLFHATTGYSLPEAVRLADRLADLPETMTSASVSRVIAEHATAHWLRQGFYRLLNRMLFRAARPEERFRVFQHFYRLPQGVIERFYAGRLTRRDQLRILSGRPPVHLGRALAVVRESALGSG